MRILILASILLLVLSSHGQILPSGKGAAWSQAGITDSINYDQQTINVLNMGAVNDSSSFTHTTIQNALDSLQGSKGTVLLPAGVYLIGRTLHIPSGVRLKGAGSDSTKLVIKTSSAHAEGISFHGSSTTDTSSLKKWYTKGSDTLKAEAGANIQPGDFVEILQNNGSWYTDSASWARKSTGMITRVTQVNGNKIFLEDPLSMALNDSLKPGIIPFDPLKNAAAECLKLRRADTSHTGKGHNVSMNFAWNCRVTGIESTPGLGAHFYLSRSAHNNIYGNYIHHSNAYDGAGTRGYGIAINHHASYNLVENNILQHLRHAMMCKTGANTNVFGYNYSREVYRSETPHNTSGDISMHGHYAFSNLFESNIVQNIVIDHYWGPSGPYNTFMRNRAENYGIIMTNAFGNSTDKQNFIGNEVSFNPPSGGQYIITGKNHFEYGNNIMGNTKPTGTSSLTDSSYYLDREPAYWNYSQPWPAIGYPNALDDNTIPAKMRYQAGGLLTLCECKSVDTTTIHKQTAIKDKLKIYPNPAATTITIELPSKAMQLEVYSANGQTVIHKSKLKNQKELMLDISHLPAGIYFLNVRNSDSRISEKFIKTGSPKF